MTRLLLALASLIRQAFCDHGAAAAHRVPLSHGQVVLRRKCPRCAAEWTEYG